MADRIVVTATGIITALGTGRQAHLSHLRSGTSVLAHPEILQTRHAQEFVVGEIKEHNHQLAERLGYEKGELEFTRTVLLSLCAMQDLMLGVDHALLQQAGARLAFINANTVGGMSEVEKLYPSLLTLEPYSEGTKWIDSMDCGASTERIARAFGLTPFMGTISTACSSSANAMIVGARMLKHGLADIVIAGGCDALSRFTLNGFNSLKNLDRKPCRPFDADRNGLNLGEGAAYVVLEREGDSLKRGATVEAVLSGWCNANDAYHPTAPSPDGAGALRTMQGALEAAGLEAGDIGYINAHGTATLNNDVAEGKAIESLWGNSAPPFSSTKPFTGHTLAAAGVVEAIISMLAMQEGFVPPNLNWSSQMSELYARPTTVVQSREISHVMSNSFGFGGNNVSLILSKP